MRLSADKLQELTRRIQPAAQVRWFREHLGVDVPRDEAGPIITRASLERLMQERLGLGVVTMSASEHQPKVQPTKRRQT